MFFSNIKSQISKKVHFIGIGGIGMSALALLLNKIGIDVQGSDINESYITNLLREKNITFFLNHNSKNIDNNIDLVVKTSIIKEDNPEIIAAKSLGIKIITRAQLLALIMQEGYGVTVSGTHGKTSTTAMISLIIEFAKLDPIVINGGIINYFKSNFKLGDGDYIIAESDESDGSFVELPTKIGAVTNIEPEHLEFYNNDFDLAKKYYERYVNQIDEKGLCVMCIDDEEVKKIYNKLKKYKNNLISYSIKDSKADIYASSIKSSNKGIIFDVTINRNNNCLNKNNKNNLDKISDINIPTFGIHNCSNSLIAIAIADFLDINENITKEALINFSGVKRRFSKVGKFNNIEIIDDYAHHPTEIKATIQAAKQFAGNNKVILVLQPHKYTRVRDLFLEFSQCVSDADIVIISEIYAASQKPIAGINQDSLIAEMKARGHKNIIKLNNENEIPELIFNLAKSGDIVLFAGAGNITYWANKLEEQLKILSSKNDKY